MKLLKPEESPLEAMFMLQLRASPVAKPLLIHLRRQFFPLAGRKFRIDYAFPHLWFGIEVDGAVHRIREQRERDCERSALLLLEGWKMLHLTGRTIRDGRGIRWTEDMLARLTASG